MGVGESLQTFCDRFGIDLPDTEADILPPAFWPEECGLQHELPDLTICVVRMALNDSFDHYNLEWCLPNRAIAIPPDLNIFTRTEDLVRTTALQYNVKMNLSDEARGYFTSYQAMFSIRGAQQRTSKNAAEGAEEGISPWKLGMLAACLLLWDVMWRRVIPYCRETWTVQVATHQYDLYPTVVCYAIHQTQTII